MPVMPEPSVQHDAMYMCLCWPRFRPVLALMSDWQPRVGTLLGQHTDEQHDRSA